MDDAEPSLEAPIVPGLELSRELGRGGRSRVFLARREGREYAVKVASDPNDEPLRRRFMREAAALACLHHPAMPQIFAVGEIDGAAYTVMENIAGTNLEELLRGQGPLDEASTLSLAIAIAQGLDAAHAYGLIHRDVKPANILVPRGEGERDSVGAHRPRFDGARLIDFDLVTRGHADDAVPVDAPSVLLGTLAYCPPEQSGMLHRPVDARSDLYALGVVMYECLAGRTPFVAAEANELLRLHAVAEPPPLGLSAPKSSLAIRAIIAALLAKDPDERYGSGASLAADLERLGEIEAHLRGGGQLKIRGERTLRRRGALVGRSHEIVRLNHWWARACSGVTTLGIVHGEAGLGKRRLLTSWRTQASPRPTVLIARSERGRAIAFAPLREALERWLDDVRREGDEGAAKLDALRGRLGDELAFLAGFAPAFTGILPEALAEAQAEEREPDGSDDEAFLSRIAELIDAFLAAIGPTIIFAENIEWLDDASAQVLRRLAIEHPQRRLLIVGTQRPGRGHSLAEVSRSFAPAELDTIELHPLTAADIQRYVELHIDAEIDPSVGEAILGRTGGSADAIVEYVRMMLDGWALRPSWGGWTFDRERLDALDLPTSFEAALRRRVDGLGREEHQLLEAAAIVGSRIDPDLLAEALELDRGGVDRSLARAVEAHVLTDTSAGLAFVHDYVRERLGEGVDGESRGELHRRIATALDRRPGERSEAEIYAIAWHYAAATSAPTERVVDACVRAGALAAQAHATEDAYTFYEAARASLGEGEVVMELSRSLGQICQRTGRTEAAIVHYRAGIRAASAALDRAELRSFLCETFSNAFRFAECRTVAAAAFDELGVAPPRASLRSLATTIGALTGRRFRRISGRPWRGRDPQSGRRRATILRLLSAINFAAYLEIDGAVALQAGLRQYAITDGEEATREQAIGTQAVASVYAVLGRERSFKRLTKEAFSQAESSGDRSAVAQVLLSRAFGLATLGDDAGAERSARRGLEIGRRWLGPSMFANGARVLTFSLQHQGRAREALEVCRLGYRRLQLATRGDNELLPHILFSLHASAHGTVGEFDRARELLDEARERLSSVGDHTIFKGTLLSAELRLAADLGGADPKIQPLVRELLDLEVDPSRLMIYHREWYFNAGSALIHRAWAEDGAVPETGELLVELGAVLQRIATVPMLAAQRAVIDAARSFFFAEGAELHQRLNAIEASAQELDCPLVLSQVAWLRALVERRRGREGATRREAGRAIAIAQEHGNQAFVLLLRRDFGGPSSPSSGSRRSLSTATISRDQASLSIRLRRHFDTLLAVSLSSSRARSSEHQAAMILDALIGMLGAERGFLFLRGHESPDFQFAGGRDARGNALETLLGYSRSIIETVWRDGVGQVLSANEQGVVAAHQSVVAHGLRSVIAAPLLLGDRRIGVVCLDSRLAAGVFTDDDLEILQAVANHIALALETARAVALDRELAEAERLAAARLDRAASAVGLAVVLVDVDARLVQHGEALHSIVGAWSTPQAWWGAVREQLERGGWRFAAMAGPGGHFAVDLVRPDGERQVFELTTTGEIEGEGADARALILIADVTPRFLGRERLERLNRELAEARDQALAASRTKSAFLMAMSHELRTPLNAVIGYDELVLDELQDPQLRDFTERSLRSSRGLLEMIQDVLEYSSLESGDAQAERQRFSIAAFVSERVEVHRAAAEARGDSLRAEVEGGDFDLVSDRGRLGMLVDKLLANAVKFTENGSVTLRAARLPAVDGSPDRVEIEIADTGQGFDEASRAALFAPFVQADTSPTRVHGGVGLGLALVRQLIALLGGSIRVESAPGRGTTVILELPRVADMPAE